MLLARRAGVALTVLLAGVGLAPSGRLAAGELPEAWSHWSRIRAVELGPSDEAAALIRLPVPLELFDTARTDLSDVRLIDAEGTEIGHLVDAPGERRDIEWRSVEASDQGFVPGEYSQVVLDTRVVYDEAGPGMLHDTVQLSLPEGTEEIFAWVEIAASKDGETWRIVRRRAPLYRFSNRPFDQGRTLRYARTRDRWLRLRFLDPDREIQVIGAQVAELAEEPVQLEPFPVRLVADSNAPTGETWYGPTDRVSRAPMAGLRVRTARDAFHRPIEVWVSEDAEAWRRVGVGQIYRYGPFAEGPFAEGPFAVGSDVEEQGAEDPPDGAVVAAAAAPAAEPTDDADDLSNLELTFSDASAPWWRVVVIDRNDPPIEDLDVELLVRPRQIVFRPGGTAPYRLIYGNPRADPPEYELTLLARREALAGARPGHLGPEERNETWSSGEPFTERHPILLWLALGLVILVLATLAVRTLRG